MQFNIAVLLGDGVGPEVASEAIKLMEAVGKKFGHNFQFQHGLVGGASIDVHGVALTKKR